MNTCIKKCQIQDYQNKDRLSEYRMQYFHCSEI